MGKSFRLHLAECQCKFLVEGLVLKIRSKFANLAEL